MKNRVVVEWAPFRLAAGASEEQLVAASRDLQNGFLAKQRGFLRRELLRGGTGNWVDLVYWADQAAAEDAMKAAAGSAICHAYFHLMADSPDAGSGVLHYSRVESYPPG